MKCLTDLCLVGLLFASAASAAPVYNIVPLGLDDGEHTRNNGFKYSYAYELNEAGQVSGYSERYNGGSTYLGRSAWLYDGATTIDIGLTGSEHTRNDGYKRSESVPLNEAGQVSGYSYRYNGGSTIFGQTAWLYNGATTIDIGLTGAEHTRNDGYKFSSAQQLNEAGQVVGYSNRYNGGSTSLGISAWLYDGANTVGIGLTGAEHTRNDGFKSSGGRELNEAGQIAGNSLRYNGGTDLGYSAWLYDGANTIDIGLTGSEHTRNDGYKYSLANLLNNSGQVLGNSYRYNGGSSQLGQSAWLYDGATTVELGFIGAEYTRNDGFRQSQALNLNEAGQVLGVSNRYNGGNTMLSQDTWVYNGAATIQIGLTGPEHTANNGYKQSTAFSLNEAGQVAGWSVRYNGGGTFPSLGLSAWFYNGATTIAVGLTGPEHTRNDGYKDGGSFPVLNEAGQVFGVSYRYNGGSTQLGQDAWFYDPALDQTFALQLSARSDGYAFSTAAYLGDDGLVLGTYTLFDALDTNLGNRAFYFTIAGGLHDLGSLVDGGLAANGWDYLANAIRANRLGQILGHGKLTSQSAGQMPYLLTPAVPEPSTLVLLLLCTTSLLIKPRSWVAVKN